MAFSTGSIATDHTMFGGFTTVGVAISTAVKWSLALNWALPAAKVSDFTVRLATTAALPTCISSGAHGVGHILLASQNGKLTIDGADVVGDRVLIKNQANALDNGIYLVGAAGSLTTPWALVRVTDFDETSEINGGAYVGVTEGTVNTGLQFVLAGSGTLSPDVVALSFALPVPTGSFDIESSEDSTDGSDGQWASTHYTFEAQPTGIAGSCAFSKADLYKYVRVRWTPTSGDGLANVDYAVST